MIQPEERVIRAFAHVAQNVPAVAEFLEQWKTTELERLPMTVNNPALAQGRCQVLVELTKFLNDAPAHAAKSNG